MRRRPTAATRRSTGTPRSPRSPRASSTSATRTAATRSSTTAAAARVTTSAAATRARSSRRSGRATAPMRWRRRRPARHWVDAHLYGGHTRGEFEHAEVSVFIGKNPWMSQSFPRARIVLNEIAKDPERSMIVIDPVDHRHREDGRLPPAGAARHRRLVPRRAGRGAGAGKPLRRGVHRRARQRRRRGPRRAATTSRSPTTPQRCGVDEELIRAAARRIARRRQRRGVRGPRHPAGAQQHAVLLPQQAAVDPHRQLRQTRRPASAFVVRPAVQRPAASAAHRSPAHRSSPA